MSVTGVVHVQLPAGIVMRVVEEVAAVKHACTSVVPHEAAVSSVPDEVHAAHIEGGRQRSATMGRSIFILVENPCSG